MGPRITVVGSSNIDFITLLPRLPGVGETVTDGSFAQVFGGKGANQAVAAARAGGAVTFVTCLGNDAYAPKYREQLTKEGISPTYIAHDATQSSGTALIMVGPAGANYIAVAPGCNNAVTPQRVRDAEPAIAASAMLVLQMEIPAESNQAAIDIARRHKIPVMLNYAPVRSKPLAIDQRIALLVVNEREAAELCGMETVHAGNAAEAAGRLLDSGVGTVLLTLGGDGAYVRSRQVAAHVPAFAVKAVDSTAAGDTFCGVLAVALSEGEPILQAARRASAAAALAVSRAGAQPSIPTRKEIEEFLSA